jgi:hypothetical protein
MLPGGIWRWNWMLFDGRISLTLYLAGRLAVHENGTLPLQVEVADDS